MDGFFFCVELDRPYFQKIHGKTYKNEGMDETSEHAGTIQYTVQKLQNTFCSCLGGILHCANPIGSDL